MKRATIYLDSELHKALKLRAVEQDSSISDIVNASVRETLREDAIDLEALEKRRKEPGRSFDTFVKSLKKRGLL